MEHLAREGVGVFGMLVIGYLFCGGTGAGALVVLCAIEHLRRRRGRFSVLLPQELLSRAWALCAGLLMVGILCLIADIGHPDRMLLFLTSPKPSILTVGAYSLGIAFVSAAFFCYAAWSDTARFPGSLCFVVGIMGSVSGCVVMGYTGVLLQGLGSVLFWQTPLLPVLFTLSSLSCGVACVLLSAAFVETRHPFINALSGLVRFDRVLIVAELVVLAVYVAWGFHFDGGLRASEALVSGEAAGVFWCGLVMAGLVAPLAMEFYLTYSNRLSQLLWIGSLVLVGGFVLRCCFVGVSAYDVTQIQDALYGLVLCI